MNIYIILQYIHTEFHQEPSMMSSLIRLVDDNRSDVPIRWRTEDNWYYRLPVGGETTSAASWFARLVDVCIISNRGHSMDGGPRPKRIYNNNISFKINIICVESAESTTTIGRDVGVVQYDNIIICTAFVAVYDSPDVRPAI